MDHCLNFSNSLDYVHLLKKKKSPYFEGIYISEGMLLTYTCTYVYKTLKSKMGERHRSCRVVFHLALLSRGKN